MVFYMKFEERNNIYSPNRSHLSSIPKYHQQGTQEEEEERARTREIMIWSLRGWSSSSSSSWDILIVVLVVLLLNEAVLGFPLVSPPTLRQMGQQERRIIHHESIQSLHSTRRRRYSQNVARDDDNDKQPSTNDPFGSDNSSLLHTSPMLYARRSWLTAATATALTPLFWVPSASHAATDEENETDSSTVSSTEPRITNRIYLTIKGLPESADTPTPNRRIVIGLYGDVAPQSVARILALVSPSGLSAPCRPRAERSLQKEQLEANKVYNSCMEGQEQGVSWQYSTLWRIVPNVRLDLGAVTGKFVARQFPDWQETSKGIMTEDDQWKLWQSLPGLVSVRRGSDSGFGCTITPTTAPSSSQSTDDDWDELRRNHIVVGRVLEDDSSMSVVQALNQVPVITTAKQFNYMALTGTPKTTAAPNRSCQYGGPMYCNENKPLVKLTITNVGLL